MKSISRIRDRASKFPDCGWRGRIRLCFAPCALLLLSACLPSDPHVGELQEEAGVETVSDVKQKSTAPEEIDPAILSSRTFGEAPILAKLVAEGKLPPVAERLPDNPLIVVPVEEIGQYGGTLRRALTGDIIQTAGVFKTLSEDLLGFSRPYPDRIEFGLAEHYEFEDEGRSIIFRLRKGLRWSDGHPFTVDDILFWYWDMEMNDDARDDPVPDSVWLVDGKPIQLEKIDDLTLRFSSAKPLGRILQAVCVDLIAYPKHRLKHLHPKYNPKANYGTFRNSTTNAMRVLNPGVPRLSAWYPVEWVRGQRVVYERNPYYWKVDSAGNQLPYADKLEFQIIQDSQVILLKFINNEIDLFGRYAQVDMFPTLKSEEAKGKIQIRITGPERGLCFYINWDCPKLELRKAFRDKRVRVALSHGINREEINQIVYHGLLEPSGFAASPRFPYYSEEAYKKYTRYDPQLANELLDEAGYIDTDGDGIRELADGSPFALNIDVRVTPENDANVVELVVEHWKDIGVKANINAVLRDILWPRRQNAEFDIHIWPLEGPDDPLAMTHYWVPIVPTQPFWYKSAYDDSPDWLREATDGMRNAMTTVNQDEVRKYMTRSLYLLAENAASIVIGSAYHVWGASTKLGNVPRDNVAAHVFRGWGRPVFHEQIFIRKERESGVGSGE